MADSLSSDKNPSRIERIKQTISVRSHFIGWLLAPIIGIIFFPTVILLFFCMLPTIVAHLIEKSPSKFAARTVGYINLSATFGLGWQLWTTDNSTQGAIDILNQLLPVSLVYLSALFGWFIYFIIPSIVDTYLQVSYEIQIRSAKYRQIQLAKEWGIDVGEGAEELFDQNIDTEEIDENISQLIYEADKKGGIRGKIRRFYRKLFKFEERIVQVAREETMVAIKEQQKEIQRQATIDGQHIGKSRRQAQQRIAMAEAEMEREREEEELKDSENLPNLPTA
jgi:hypothetical protein